jgi:hypothetical protein
MIDLLIPIYGGRTCQSLLLGREIYLSHLSLLKLKLLDPSFQGQTLYQSFPRGMA